MTVIIPEYLKRPRFLHFPDDRSVGWLDIRDWRGQEEDPWEGNYLSDTPNQGSDWRKLGEARGTVNVPAGVEVRLRINREAASDLSCMAKLATHALQVLSLAATPVTGDQLRYLSHLSGLHTLNLWATSVTARGFEHLQKLPGLGHFAYSPAEIHNEVAYPDDGAGISLLGALTNLETLCLHVGQTTANDLAFLESLPKLHTLRLVNASSLNLAGVKQMSRMSALRILGIPGASIRDDDLAHLAKLKNLRELDLSETDLDGSGFIYLRSLPQLDTLNLHKMRRGIAEANLASLCHLPQLTRINYAENSLGETGLKHLARVPNLRQLDLAGGTGVSAKLTSEGLKHLSTARQLEVLKLSDTTLDENSLVYVGELTELRQLYLNGLEVGDRGLAYLARLAHLQVLDLWSTRASDLGLIHLQGLTNLHELHLADTQVCGTGLIHLRGLTHLRKLSLGGAVEFQVSGLAHLRQSMNLVDLYLHGQGFTNAIFVYLQEFPRLQNLTLFSTQVDDSGLANVAAFTALKSLNLAGSQVSDAGLLCLVQLPDLVELDLSGTRVSDAGLGTLAQLHNLEHLYLHNTLVTPERVTELRHSMPNCLVSS